MATTSCYFIECRSNLHAGSGNESHGVIDKAVQRDVASKFPVVHGSGLKGALREFYQSESWANQVFGSNPKESDPNKKSKPGEYNFHDAWLLSYPVRSNVRPYFQATSPQLILEFLQRCEDFGIELENTLKTRLKELADINPRQPLVFRQPDFGVNILLEDWEADKEQDEFQEEDLKQLEAVVGTQLALLPHHMLEELTQNLPVIARNYLENGQSANLWYEEVVPRGARFYTVIEDLKSAGIFDPSGRKQIGGNATVGHGQVIFQKL